MKISYNWCDFHSRYCNFNLFQFKVQSTQNSRWKSATADVTSTPGIVISICFNSRYKVHRIQDENQLQLMWLPLQVLSFQFVSIQGTKYTEFKMKISYSWCDFHSRYCNFNLFQFKVQSTQNSRFPTTLSRVLQGITITITSYHY